MDTETQEKSNIEKSENSGLNFYTDPNSPYMDCPERVKRLFDSSKVGEDVDE